MIRSGIGGPGKERSRQARSAPARPGPARPGSNLRILGGTLRSRRLAVASGVRPTEARLREALFSIWHPRIEGCNFLDLFAGAGAVGLEALSRGARQAVFAELSPRVLATLRRNLKLVPGAARPRRARLPRDLDRLAADGCYDLIFADPPYDFAEYEELLQRSTGLLALQGEMAIEHSARADLAGVPEPWRCWQRRCYGDSCLSFFRLRSVGDPS